MSDHADTVRDYLFPSLKRPHVKSEEAVAALDALVAERDEARRRDGVARERAEVLVAQLEAAEADRDRYKAALEEISNDPQAKAVLVARAVLSVSGRGAA